MPAPSDGASTRTADPDGNQHARQVIIGNQWAIRGNRVKSVGNQWAISGQSSALSGSSEAIKCTHLPHHALAQPLDTARWQRPPFVVPPLWSPFVVRSLAAPMLLLPRINSNR